MPLAKDLLYPRLDLERRQHKKKRLVQTPNSYFMDVKCPGCYKITSVQPCPDSGSVCGLRHCVVSAQRGESQTDRRLLF